MVNHIRHFHTFWKKEGKLKHVRQEFNDNETSKDNLAYEDWGNLNIKKQNHVPINGINSPTESKWFYKLLGLKFSLFFQVHSKFPGSERKHWKQMSLCLFKLLLDENPYSTLQIFWINTPISTAILEYFFTIFEGKNQWGRRQFSNVDCSLRRF